MEMSDEHVKIRVFIKDKGNLLANATISLETALPIYILVLLQSKTFKSGEVKISTADSKNTSTSNLYREMFMASG